MNGLSESTRRSMLVGVGGTTIGALAGCLGDGGQQGENTTGTLDSAELLDPPVAGDPAADVTVAVYEDFACPHCKRFNESVYPSIRDEYIDDGSIRYEHRDFPIPVSETVSWDAPNAAREVQASVGDDAFFEYTTLLFANQGSLGADTYESLAADVNADGGAVRAAAAEQRYDSTVRRDRERGVDAGVQGTPTAIVDGTVVEASYEAISAAIEDAQSDSA